MENKLQRIEIGLYFIAGTIFGFILGGKIKKW